MRAWLLLGALLLGACGERGAPCEVDSACAELEACQRGFCREVECRSNLHCPLETTCNVETYTCDAGCQTSDDCFVGDRCDVLAGQCVPRQCTDTQLDCDFGERCDLDRGECFEDPAPHCARCVDDAQCGPTGACGLISGSVSARCFLECSPEAADPCPSGMQCTRTVEDLFRCIGFCGGL